MQALLAVLLFLNPTVPVLAQHPKDESAQKHAESRDGKPDSSPFLRIIQAQRHQNAADDSAQQKKHERLHDSWTVLSLKIDTALAILTLFALIPAYWMIWQTRRISQRELRAYVGARAKIVDGRKNQGGGFVLTLEHFGQTPARKCCYATAWEVKDVKAEKRLYQGRSTPYVPMGTMMPGSRRIVKISLETMPDDVRAQLMSDDVRLYITGKLKYQDVFSKKPWETPFSFQFGGTAGIGDDLGTGRLAMTEDGNDAT